MTTEATQQPQAPQPQVMDVSEVYRILGTLQQAHVGTEQQLVEVKQQLIRHEERNDQQFARLEERNDQQFARLEERNDQQLARLEERNDQRFERHEERNDAQNRETNRRIDRVWYTIVGGTIAILAGMAGLAVQIALSV